MKNTSKQTKKGVALIIAMFCAIVAMGMIVALQAFLEASHQEISNIIANKGQAINIAHAGLMDALSWFRKNASARNNRFFPNVDRSDITNLIEETDDPVIGLVREHVLSEEPLLIGRYEIRRQYYNSSHPDDPNKEDGYPDGDYNTIDTQTGVYRVNPQRLMAKNLYRVTSHGYIFKVVCPANYAYGPLHYYRNVYSPKQFYLTNSGVTVHEPDGSARFLPQINRYNRSKVLVYARAAAACEIVQRVIDPPYEAAVCYRGKIEVRNRGAIQNFVDASSVATARPNASGTSAPSTYSGGSIKGYNIQMTATSSYGPYEDTIEKVFGLANEAALAADPDTVVYNSVDDLQLRPYKIAFLGDPDVSDLPNFVIDHRITGTNTILYVKGNLTIQANKNFSMSGMLFVVGTLQAYDTSYITGAVIIQNRRSTNPSYYDRTSVVKGETDASFIIYQPQVLEDIRKMMGQYTFYIRPYVFQKEDLLKLPPEGS